MSYRVFKLKNNLILTINAFNRESKKKLNVNEILEALNQTKSAVKNIDKGLNYDLEHLKKIKKEIINKTREEQAKYADEICVNNINNTSFIASQFKGVNVNDSSLFKEFNTTSIGNLAFLSLNASDKYAKKAEAILNNYKVYKARQD